MSHLISTYAGATGLTIDPHGPYLQSDFIALPFSRYVTIQTGSGQAAKNYDYWQEVVAMIGPVLARHQIVIVLMGAKDDPLLQGVYDMRGKTSPQQAQFLIQNALLHMGNDSWLAHCAGWNRKPVVALYGSTSVENHGPYWGDEATTILLSSHRNGGVPTYSSQETPKTINLIRPEQVCNAVMSLLRLPGEQPFSHETRLIGLLYTHALFDLVPNAVVDPSFLPSIPLTVRMDYHHDETILRGVLATGRRVNILTKKPVDAGLLAQFRPSILSYTHEIDASCPIGYAALVPSIIKHTTFFTKEKDSVKVSELRFQFFDVCSIQTVTDVTKEDYLTTSLQYLNRESQEGARQDLEREIQNGSLKFKSNKYILSGGKMYLSPAHLKAGIAAESLTNNVGSVIDESEYWKDANHYLIYNQP